MRTPHLYFCASLLHLRALCATLNAHAAPQPVHIDLLSDDDDADADDKPIAETVPKRPVRAAAAAAQSLSQKLAGLKGALSSLALLRVAAPVLDARAHASPRAALYPPEGDPHAVEVSAADLSHLQPSEFLNDTVIDLYLKKLLRVRGVPSAQRLRGCVCLLPLTTVSAPAGPV